MKQETKDKKDAEAIAKLQEWCKPLKLDLIDDGYSLCLALSGRLVKEARYKPTNFGKTRSKASAANELINALAFGSFVSFVDERYTNIAGGATMHERRTYEFRIPRCSSPVELGIKLDLDGWTPPSPVSDGWKAQYSCK